MNTTTVDKTLIELFMNWQVREFNPKDWSDLMEVVEKIESLNFYKGSVIIQELKCTIYYENKIICVKSDDTSKIEAVYNACIAFINWYNEQKQYLANHKNSIT